MNINNMDFEDYMNLFLFNSYMKDKNKEMYVEYKNNFHPTRQDVEDYNKKVEQFKKAWEKDKALVHKPIFWEKPPEEVKEDNNFEFCQEVGHKFELWVEKEFKKYDIDIGMFYDERQLEGENEFGIEIKHDSKLQETNNVYIEYQALTKDESKFYDSGILKKDNSKYWLIGTEKEYYIFYKNDLLKLYEELMRSSKKMYYQENGDIYYGLKDRRTSKAVVISRKKCKEMMIADNIFEFLLKIGKIEVE